MDKVYVVVVVHDSLECAPRVYGPYSYADARALQVTLWQTSARIMSGYIVSIVTLEGN